MKSQRIKFKKQKKINGKKVQVAWCIPNKCNFQINKISEINHTEAEINTKIMLGEDFKILTEETLINFEFITS